MTPEEIRKHIDRYFVARYGKGYVYRAPETYDNMVERWMLSVAADNGKTAEECISEIEHHWKSN